MRSDTLAPDAAPSARLSAGSSVDWRGLEEQHRELRGFLEQRCRDPHDAEDAAQEALLKAACSRSGRGGPRRLEPWLRTIAANVLTDRRRSVGRRREVADVEAALVDLRSEAPDPSEGIDDDEEVWLQGRPIGKQRLVRLLQAVLASAGREDREVLESFYGTEAGSCRAVAERIGIRPDLVKVRLYRARRRLRRRCLDALGAEACSASGGGADGEVAA